MSFSVDHRYRFARNPARNFPGKESLSGMTVPGPRDALHRHVRGPSLVSLLSEVHDWEVCPLLVNPLRDGTCQVPWQSSLAGGVESSPAP